MVDDPIIDEIHKVRQEVARRFNYDMHAIGNYLRKQQERSARKVVDLSGRTKKKPATQGENE